MIHALLDNAKALADLLHAHYRAIETVAFFADRDVELELFVTGIRLLSSKVPFESARAQHGARDAPINCFLCGDSPNALCARLKNPVRKNLAVIFGETRRQVFQEI